jgi:hypothetical protein
MTVTIRGKGSKTRYVPVMDPTARLLADYLKHLDPHPGLGADADPLFHGPNHSRLTRSGIAKLLARHVRAVRARDPSYFPRKNGAADAEGCGMAASVTWLGGVVILSVARLRGLARSPLGWRLLSYGRVVYVSAL